MKFWFKTGADDGIGAASPLLKKLEQNGAQGIAEDWTSDAAYLAAKRHGLVERDGDKIIRLTPKGRSFL